MRTVVKTSMELISCHLSGGMWHQYHRLHGRAVWLGESRVSGATLSLWKGTSPSDRSIPEYQVAHLKGRRWELCPKNTPHSFPASWELCSFMFMHSTSIYWVATTCFWGTVQGIVDANKLIPVLLKSGAQLWIQTTKQGIKIKWEASVTRRDTLPKP